MFSFVNIQSPRSFQVSNQWIAYQLRSSQELHLLSTQGHIPPPWFKPVEVYDKRSRLFCVFCVNFGKREYLKPSLSFSNLALKIPSKVSRSVTNDVTSPKAAGYLTEINPNLINFKNDLSSFSG